MSTDDALFPAEEQLSTDDAMSDDRARFRAALAGPDQLAARMGIELLEVAAGRVMGRMPVDGNRQPLGLLHGGASCVLAETLGSVAAAVHAGPDRVALGVDLNATHHRPAAAGYVTGTCQSLHLGRTSASFEIVVIDEQDRRICTARLTCALRPAS